MADVVIDNLAPVWRRHPCAGRALDGGVPVGAVSSITSAFIAQLLTIGVAERIRASGRVPPLYLSANIPGGDEHNHALEESTKAGSPAAASSSGVPCRPTHHTTTRSVPTPGRHNT